jgi:hypothetical protein
MTRPAVRSGQTLSGGWIAKLLRKGGAEDRQEE